MPFGVRKQLVQAGTAHLKNVVLHDSGPYIISNATFPSYFLKDDAAVIQEYLDAAQGLLEDEAYRSACFYDSTTRTKRSAINAYEQFLADYPQSEHAEEVKARIEELKEKESR